MKRLLVAFILVTLVGPAWAQVAIQRSDGTYSAWTRYGKPRDLLPGESYVPMSDPPIVTVLVVPDFAGFLKWIPTAFDFPTINALAKAYPEFHGYASNSNAAGVQWCITDAKSKGTITGTQYTLLQGANAAYHTCRMSNCASLPKLR